MKDQVLPDLDQVLPETTQMPGSQRDSSTVLVPDHQKTITLIEIDDSTSSSTNSVASTSSITIRTTPKKTIQTARKKTFAPKQTRVEAAMRDGLSTTSSTGVSEIFIENDIAETPGSYISISGEYDIVAIAFKRFIQRKVIG